MSQAKRKSYLQTAYLNVPHGAIPTLFALKVVIKITQFDCNNNNSHGNIKILLVF